MLSVAVTCIRRPQKTNIVKVAEIRKPRATSLGEVNCDLGRCPRVSQKSAARRPVDRCLRCLRHRNYVVNTSRPVRPTGEFRGNGSWISVSSLSWMSGEEGPVSLSVPSCLG